MDNVIAEDVAKGPPHGCLKVAQHLLHRNRRKYAAHRLKHSAVVTLPSVRHNHETQRNVLHLAAFLHERVYRE